MNEYYAFVHRHSKNAFTGVPLAISHSGIWYWPDRTEAEKFAEAFDLPTAFIGACEKGWTIRMQIDGPYVQEPPGFSG